jgi:multiple sugar transport system substrate-binding protein
VTRTYLSWLALAAVCAVVTALLWPSAAGSPEEAAALREGRVIVTYWDRHSGHEHEARAGLIREYNDSQGREDGVYVRALPVGYNALMEKLLTSISGGSPPGIVSLDGGILAQLAARDCFIPLDDFLASDPALSEEAFFPHIWRAVRTNGKAYGVPTTCDTFCLLWNKAAFRKAGLDPERPPQTLGELEEYAARLTVQDERGLHQIGFLPWQPWDHTFQWGCRFGGTWYDDTTGQVGAADDPGIVASLEWQRRFARRPGDPDPSPIALDPERVANFSRGFGAYASATNPFYTGKLAMVIDGEWQCTFIPRFAPDLDWGVAPIPAPEGAVHVAYSDTCIADCVPKGTEHPEAVFKFLRWFHTPRPGGGTSPASDYCHAISNIPVRPAEAQQPRFVDNPKFRVFVDDLLNSPVASFPVTPETQYMITEVETVREQVIFWESEPEAALRALQDRVNARLDATRAFLERHQP